TQAAADQALDLEGAAALLAARGFAVAAGMSGAGQHAVLGRDPTLALAAQEGGHPVLDAGSAQHAGAAEGDQHRALRVPGIAAGDADLAQLRGRAATGALEVVVHAGEACALRGSASLARVRYAWPADPEQATTSQPPPGATMPVRSMTAYASAERTSADGTLACELRAVNHRFLEVGLRLPDEL